MHSPCPRTFFDMKKFSPLFLIGTLFLAGCGTQAPERQVSAYNVRWTSPSESPKGSMPLSGHGGYGANVWVERGTVYLYLGSANSYDENGNLLKLGRLGLTLTPNPFEEGGEFVQELDLYNGQILLSGRTPAGFSAQLKLWIDPVYDALHIETEASEPVELTASYATWRDRDTVTNLDNWNWFLRQDEVTRADQVLPVNGGLCWYHRNVRGPILDSLLAQQAFTQYRDLVPDPTAELIFGGMIRGDSLRYGGQEKISTPGWEGTEWNLNSAGARPSHRLVVTPHARQGTGVLGWQEELFQSSLRAQGEWEALRRAHEERWHRFWERSFILINLDKGELDEGFQVGRNYQLFRYMLATNEDGRLPLRFNGGIFTFDPMTRDEFEFLPEESYFPPELPGPDYSRWGNLIMAQNQRLIGWPALASGDFQLMTPSLDFYRDRLPVAEARSECYWGHGGAAFPEHLSIYGLPVGKLATATGESSAPHLRYHFSIQLEFAYMALLRAKYSGESPEKYLPLAEGVLRFFDEHYQKESLKHTGKPYDSLGHLVIYPANSLEYLEDATNPVEVLAGLWAVTHELVSLPAEQLEDSTWIWLADFVDRIPPIGYEQRDSQRVIRAADSFQKKFNFWEWPELYTVFPYNFYHAGDSTGLSEALATWRNLPKERSQAAQSWSWQCTPAYAAMLGQREDARRLIVEKLSDERKNVRFPAFFGPGHDWVPDMNWGGSGMVGLQRMLLNTDERGIYLFPAWPADWDVEFRLYGYGGVRVDGRICRGGAPAYSVLPASAPQQVHNLFAK